MSNLKAFFPANRGRWIKYTLTSLPVIFSALIFALNSFVDNFMATIIPGGNQALAYANTWTTIVTGIIAATTIIGSALYGQYFATNDVKKIREIIRGRIVIALGITIIFTIPALIWPEFLMQIASGFDQNVDQKIMNSGSRYLRWIAISWLFSTWGYTMAMILRESGYGNATLISSCLCLGLNIVLNIIFINLINKDLELLSYSTNISLIIGSIVFFVIYIFIKDKRLLWNPLKMFAIPLIVWKQFIKRIPSFLLFCIGSITVSIRYVFWNHGYPTGSIGNNPEYQIAAANILGISGMFFSIFWNTFESINANVTIFVGRELGENNYLEAKKNAKELQGFHMCVSIIMALLLVIVSVLITKMNFLTEGYKSLLEQQNPPINSDVITSGAEVLLVNIQNTLWPLAWNIPFWVWYITKNRIISTGGKTNLTASIEAIVGLISTAWIVSINYSIICKQIEFPWAYALFFVPDLIIKTACYEWIYYKVEWARNITKEFEKVTN